MKQNQSFKANHSILYTN